MINYLVLLQVGDYTIPTSTVSSRLLLSFMMTSVSHPIKKPQASSLIDEVVMSNENDRNSIGTMRKQWTSKMHIIHGSATRSQGLILPVVIIATAHVVWGFQKIKTIPDTANRPLAVLHLSFSSCPPPRFDEFGEKLLGNWKGQSHLRLMNLAAPSQGEEVQKRSEEASGLVEEVMRSCGGAVQGIREFAPIGDISGSDTSSQQEGLYLNRANDGFLFLDDGSYSFGPVMSFEGGGSKSGSQPGPLFVSNHMIGGRRIIVWGEISSTDDDLINGNLSCNSVQCLNVKRKKYGSGVENLNDPANVEAVEFPREEDLQSLKMSIHHKVRCRMPSSGQPWMLQRAKWEQIRFDASSEDNPNDNEFGYDGDSSSSSSLRCWVVASKSDGNNAPIIFQDIDDELMVPEGSIIQSAVVVDDAMVHAIQRYYNSNDNLVGVVFLQGRKLSKI